MADAGWPGGTKPGPGGGVANGTCATCGHAYAPGARFCDGCGNPVSPTLDPAVAPAVAPAPPDDLLDALRSATIGEYDLYGLLGRGGMASVYLALDLALNRQVAIKVISMRELHSEDGAVRFLREAQTAAHLSHPNIIPIHSVKRTSELLYFVMRFVEGSPLDAVIKEAGTLPVRMARAILSQVATALQFAHRKGVIHRDIKPANIMIDEDGNSIVTDFGIAKVESKTNLTMTGAVMGTPYYMSPEQISGHQITGAADQYSLGVVAYEMLTGRPPFMGDSVMTLMKAHLWDPPQPLHDVRPELPTHLADTVMRMLSKEPADRWPDLSEFVRALDARHLPEDDALRSQIIDLTRTGLSKRPRVSVPLSPMPPARRPKPAAASGAAPAATAPPAPSVPAEDPLTTARKEVERLEAEEQKRREAERMATERIDAAPLAKAAAASAPTAQVSAYASVTGAPTRPGLVGAPPVVAAVPPARSGRRRLIIGALAVGGVAIAASGVWISRAISSGQNAGAAPTQAADSARAVPADSTVASADGAARDATPSSVAPSQTAAPAPATTTPAGAPPPAATATAAASKATKARAPDVKPSDTKPLDRKATDTKGADARAPDPKQVAVRGTEPVPPAPKPSAARAESAAKVAVPPSPMLQKPAVSDAGAKPAATPAGPSAADLAAARGLACNNPATASMLLTSAFAGDAAARLGALYQPRDGGDGKAKASFIDLLKGARGATASVKTERNEPTADSCQWVMAVELKWVNAFGQPRQKSGQLRLQLDGSSGAARIAHVFGATGF